ncbi:hypothetical protein BofuT4_uP033200.1 [Botrytis cinerea T4]|uniref:Uncharacterized protein n=1 Tax=Botryotinia fuckeliana (strain T4) TaxID=999810 RepID=G2Y7V0_BOTF4|nr:hypothetical protein BofuT4_uP033200.1 [Botrytis cinerea T4]
MICRARVVFAKRLVGLAHNPTLKCNFTHANAHSKLRSLTLVTTNVTTFSPPGRINMFSPCRFLFGNLS